MFGKKTSPAETLPEDEVKLKPLFGIRPGVYLAWFYGFIILGILFWLLLYPGLARPGSLLAFSSEPRGAAIRLDGVYWGTTPGTFFVPQGKHQIEIILPGFDSYRAEREIGGRLFASRFFPRRESLHGILGLTRPGEVLSRAAAEYAAWSLAGEPTAAYQIPLSLSEGAYRSGPAGADPAVYRQFSGILSNSLGFTITRSGLRDLIRAKHLIDNGGLSPSPVTLLRSAGDILDFLSETPDAARWLGTLLPPETAALLTSSSWYRRTGESPPAPDPRASEPGSPERSPVPAFPGFRAIPGGTLAQNTPVPRNIAVEGFSIAETEVSLASWEAFVRANPEWGKENTPALTERGLVTGEYLEGPDNPGGLSGYPAASAPGISWYGAQAYCRWLTAALPPSLASYEARLPTEAEWEYAAKTLAGSAGGEAAAGVRDMLGGMWEWCGDPFVPFPFLVPSGEGELPFDSPEKTVRGGSWANPSGTVGPETRGSLPPGSCSPFVAFRPVIALRGNP
jgi:hypothetical protein